MANFFCYLGGFSCMLKDKLTIAEITLELSTYIKLLLLTSTKQSSDLGKVQVWQTDLGLNCRLPVLALV